MSSERVEYVISLKDLYTPKINAALGITKKLEAAISSFGSAAKLSFSTAYNRANSFTNQLRATAAETRKLGNEFSNMGIKASSGFRTASAGAKQNSIQGKVGGGVASMGVMGAASSLLAPAAIAKVAYESLQTSAKLQSLKNAIDAASGSSENAGKNIKFLDKTILDLGLPLEEAYKGFKTWQGSVMGTSLDGEKARKIFLDISKATTVMGLSGEDAEGVFLAMGQMMSKGTVQAEELKGQLGERLPGAFRRAADAMGMTTMQLGKALQKGEVLAEDLLPKLGEQLGMAFSKDQLEKASHGTQANMNRIGNSIKKVMGEIGNSIAPILDKIATKLPEIMNIVEKIMALTAPALKVLGVIWDVTLFFIEKISNAMDWLYKRLKPVIDFLKTGFSYLQKFFGIKDKTVTVKSQFSEPEKTLSSVMPKNPTKDGSGKKDTTELNNVESRKATNINITIGKLIEHQEIVANGIKETGQKISEEVKKVLLTMLNDVNVIAQ